MTGKEIYVDIVEVNSTFYRPAPPAMVRSWLKRIEARPDLLLSLKLYQAFTHAREGFSGQDVDAVRQAADLVRLQGRLAALLVQFPWSFRNSPENAAYLRRLLELFDGYPLAVEVRHASWDTPALYELLGAHRAASCNIDQPLFEASIRPSAVSTTPDFGYVRLHGRNYHDWFLLECSPVIVILPDLFLTVSLDCQAPVTIRFLPWKGTYGILHGHILSMSIGLRLSSVF